jgi:cell division inhibitor SulA/protein ImuA
MSQPQLSERSDIWCDDSAAETPAVSSGFVELDALLPSSGFPVGALTEVIVPRFGVGELRLLLPAITRLMRERWLALVAPPYIPYAPTLSRAGVDLSHVLVVNTNERSDTLWATEQALRVGTCGAVLSWPAKTDFKWLRRLQLAAEAGGTMGVVFSPMHYAATSSPAALRLRLEPQADGLAVHVVKRRGGWSAGPLLLDWSTLRQGRRLRREVSHAMAMPWPSQAAAGNLHADSVRR